MEAVHREVLAKIWLVGQLKSCFEQESLTPVTNVPIPLRKTTLYGFAFEDYPEAPIHANYSILLADV